MFKMVGNLKGEDGRILKTQSTLVNALIILLKKKNFNNITVNALCNEALISRTAFYAHFNDKYDLLKYYLSDLNIQLIKDLNDYKKLEKEINQFIQENKKIITNVLSDANNETLDLVNNFVSTIIDSIIEKYDNSKNKNIVILSDFCTGGIVNMIMLQVKNHFSEDDDMMSLFLFDMIRNIMNWVHDNDEEVETK